MKKLLPIATLGYPAAKALIATGFFFIPLLSLFPPAESCRSVETGDAVVALTFDDGPSIPYTRQILDVLRQHGAQATFFMLGEHIASHPDVAREVVREGHEVGNHSYLHRSLQFESYDGTYTAISLTDFQIRHLGVEGEIHFRPPYGMTYGHLPRVLASMGKKCILYDVISQDWGQEPAEVVSRRVMQQVRGGSIVLFHDGNGDRSETVRATAMVIAELQSRGYKPVTVSQLLASGAR